MLHLKKAENDQIWSTCEVSSDMLLIQINPRASAPLITSPLFLQVVWPREGLQCPSDGPAWAQSGGPLQLLLSPLHHEDGPYAGRPGSSTHPDLPLCNLLQQHCG